MIKPNQGGLMPIHTALRRSAHAGQPGRAKEGLSESQGLQEVGSRSWLPAAEEAAAAAGAALLDTSGPRKGLHQIISDPDGEGKILGGRTGQYLQVAGPGHDECQQVSALSPSGSHVHRRRLERSGRMQSTPMISGLLTSISAGSAIDQCLQPGLPGRNPINSIRPSCRLLCSGGGLHCWQVLLPAGARQLRTCVPQNKRYFLP